ncbi:MAG: hypothetical protein R3C68_12470 [Myxococcota bacterium]
MRTHGILRQIIRKWPKDADGAGNAIFNSVNCTLTKKYAGTMQEYIQVIEKFADSNLVDDAYYRIGTCSMEMSNFEDAQIFFNKNCARTDKKSPLLSNARRSCKNSTNTWHVSESARARQGQVVSQAHLGCSRDASQ